MKEEDWGISGEGFLDISNDRLLDISSYGEVTRLSNGFLD